LGKTMVPAMLAGRLVFDLARVDYYMKYYIGRPSRAPSRSIAHG
jgi:hypothetical protein